MALTLLGISGSLRAGSFNTACLKALVEAPPEGATVTLAEIRDIPLYDEDIRAQGLPPAVQRLRAQIAACDGLIFATPEYNYSIPGVLKNAIDWVSRPPDQPFAGKPATLFGATNGKIGTARAQYDLRKILHCLGAELLTRPEVMISEVSAKVQDGVLTDAETIRRLQEQAAALVRWSRLLAAGRKALAE